MVRLAQHDEHGIPGEDARGRPCYVQKKAYSYVRQWRAFESLQLSLAQSADVKIHASRRYPVLADVALLRSWWLRGAIQGGAVHRQVVPLLSCVLPRDLIWSVLRFAGHLCDDDGGVVGIANTTEELHAVQRETGLGESLAFTGPGVHDDQLTIEEFLAWRRVECSARLEYMAEARGRPRPGQQHPDAAPDDPDGVHGGDRPEDAAFEQENALPGGDDADAGEDDGRLHVDPEVMYSASRVAAISDEQVFDMVHQVDEAKQHSRSKRSQKHGLFSRFRKEHEGVYEEARQPRDVLPAAPGQHPTRPCAGDHAVAAKHQHDLAESRAREDEASQATPQPVVFRHCVEATTAGAVVAISAERLPLSPIEYAAQLIAESGIWRSKEQYLATLFVLEPLQVIWEKALREGRLEDLQSPGGVVRAMRDVQVRPVLLHGQGGSGKTYCMTEVVNKVFRAFLGKRGLKAIAAQNSSARLLLGKTMHAAGKMTRGQSLKAKALKPHSQARKALEREWADLALLLVDEVSMASPALLVGVSRRDFHGRSRMLRVAVDADMEHPFGDVLLQVLTGDFLQLNPVANHTLLESLCSTRVPGVPKNTEAEDEDGYRIFKSMCKNVVLFTGTHRFLDSNLPALLDIMRTPGGRRVPDALRAKVLAGIQAGPDDPRLSIDFAVEGQRGFFALGGFAAIQWERVTRMVQLQVLRHAACSRGPVAACNTAEGKPDRTSAPTGTDRGQLVYYFQAVDRFKHLQDREMYLRALRFVNLSKSAGMHGMFGVFVGMRVRLTKKILGPELVQEATGEVVGKALHPEERFGHPASSNVHPASSHECWERGWVLCDRLPLHVEVRFDESAEDYTGLGKPGVWHVAPRKDTWKLPVDAAMVTINHPGAARPKVIRGTSRKHSTVEVLRCQLPLTNEDEMTYQNAQGKTV